MAKIRLTKSELKKQKEELKMYKQYLPTLQLKKQQLQMEINKIQHMLDDEKKNLEKFEKSMAGWIGVFAEEVGLKDLIEAEKVLTETGNIAGIDIPVFKEVRFREEAYDLVRTPLWVDDGVGAVKEMITYKVKIMILEEQLRLVQEELRTTTQRVNLFEKVKIPEKQENIRKIQIFLGDLDTAAVVTGKIAKEKIQKKENHPVGAK